MRVLRRVVNSFLRPLIADTTAEVRDADLRVLSGLARVASIVRIPNADRMSEAWMLDCFRILVSGIVNTPYKAELSLPYPLVITVSSANKCALGCSSCYSSSTTAPTQEAALTRELSEKIAEFPIPIVFITGGEPFHHPRLGEVMEPILASGKKVIIATNAPSTQAANGLLEYRDQITLVLSQWGEQSRHDAVRGQGNLERTHAGAERLAGLGHRVSLNYVLSPNPISEELDALEEILAGSLHLHRVYVSRELLVGRTPAGTCLGVYDGDFRQRIKSLCARFPGRLVPVIPELLSTERISAPSLITRMLGIVLPASCGAASWTLHVDSQGMCYPCFAHEGRLSIGSLWTDGLDTVWNRGRLLQQSSSAITVGTCWAEINQDSLGLVHNAIGKAYGKFRPGNAMDCSNNYCPTLAADCDVAMRRDLLCCGGR